MLHAIAAFQSAPRSVERGDRTLDECERNVDHEFQSAPRSVERGDNASEHADPRMPQCFNPRPALSSGATHAVDVRAGRV